MSASVEIAVRLGCLCGVLTAMAVWELLAPRRTLSVRKLPRWSSNLGLMVLNTLAARLAIPLSAAGLAVLAAERGWGVLNLLQLPDGVELLLAVLALDLAIYLQHVLFHAVPALWRLHAVHHADLDCDVTTGVRFHTLEMLLSAVLKLGVILALGPSAWAVLIFEVLLNAASLFSHGNVRIAPGVERWLRWAVVTPDMHRVHHSTTSAEMNSNFGFNVPWWDYLLGTYRPQPAAGHAGMQVGLADLRDERQVERLPGMLALPFVRDAGGRPLCGAGGAAPADSPPPSSPRRD